MNGTEEIGCCGTCREYQKTCKGCKAGYLDGSRDLRRARCKMKKCCLTRGCVTCGDCGEYDSCEIIQWLFRSLCPERRAPRRCSSAPGRRFPRRSPHTPP